MHSHPYSVWQIDDGRWSLVLGTEQREAAEQVVRALKNQRKSAKLFGTIKMSTGYSIGTKIFNPRMGRSRLYYWGMAPDASTAYAAAYALDHLIRRSFPIHVRTPENQIVRYDDLLERTPYA